MISAIKALLKSNEADPHNITIDYETFTDTFFKGKTTKQTSVQNCRWQKAEKNGRSSKKMDRGLQSRNLRNIDWDTAYRSRSARSARSPDFFSGYAKHENKKIRKYKNKKFPSLPLTLQYTENPHLINILLAKPYIRFLLFISLSNEFLDVCTFLFYFYSR